VSLDDPNKVIVGRIGKTFGVKGWLHIHSFSEPEDNICQYQNWLIRHENQWQRLKITEVRRHQPGFIAKIDSIDNPEQARLLTNCDIAIDSNDLPTLDDHEFYRHELIGMSVINQNGKALGKVTEIMETGSNDVFIVEGQQRELIPYLDHVITAIDRQNKIITVDWDSISE